MSFLSQNIDKAIEQTRYDLEGFVHPVWGRGSRDDFSPKDLDATTWNFLAFSAGFGIEDQDPSHDLFQYRGHIEPFENVL